MGLAYLPSQFRVNHMVRKTVNLQSAFAKGLRGLNRHKSSLWVFTITCTHPSCGRQRCQRSGVREFPVLLFLGRRKNPAACRHSVFLVSVGVVNELPVQLLRLPKASG